MKITKALQTRSEAIRKAIMQYNTEAGKLLPPWPKLSWKEVVEYSFLAKFDLLQESHHDICTADWAQPARWEATITYLRLKHAQEEIARLNVEYTDCELPFMTKPCRWTKPSRSSPLLTRFLQRS